MQRQSSIAEVASHLGITPNAVKECIESGLFLSTHSHNLGGHLLDKQECEWAWMQYTDQVANHPNVTLESLSRAVAYVKHLRVLILEEGSYFEGIDLMKGQEEKLSVGPSIALKIVVGMLVFIVIFLSFT